MSTESDDYVETWEGYSDYEFVSRRMSIAIDEAVDAYSKIRAMHREGARIRPQPAAKARSRIYAAALRVLVEMEGQDGEKYTKILDRWKREDDDDEDGYLDRLDTVQLQTRCPDWLYQMVKDIRTAGWELGYLQAGRKNRERTDDSPEAEASEMFDGL